MEPIGLFDGRLMQVHSADLCVGSHCCIHNPSKHPLNKAPLNWRSDRQIMERVCPHGIGHPDPDDLVIKHIAGAGVHGCDGCCHASP